MTSDDEDDNEIEELALLVVTPCLFSLSTLPPLLASLLQWALLFCSCCRGAGRMQTAEEALAEQQGRLRRNYDELRQWAGQLDEWRQHLHKLIA